MNESLLSRLDLGFRRRVPMIHQSEAAECGLACVAMIAGYHGQHVELAELRRRNGLATSGATLLDLTRIAETLQLSSRPLRVELAELRALTLPCVLHWEMQHFVVLTRVDSRGLVIHDPGAGVRTVAMSEASAKFTGVALELMPSPGFRARAPVPSMRLMDVMGHVVGVRQTLGVLFVLALALEGFAILGPMFMQWVVDHALVAADLELLTILALGFGLVALVQVVLKAMRGWTLMSITASLSLQGKSNLFSHLTRLRSSFFESRHLGDIVSRFGSLSVIQRALTTDLIETVLDGIMVLVTGVIMLMISPTLAAVVLVGAAAYAAMRVLTYRRLRELSVDSIVYEAKAESHFLETIRAIRTVKLYGAEQQRRAEWLNTQVDKTNRDLTVSRLRLGFKLGDEILIATVAILVVWLGARAVLAGQFTVGVLLAFIAYQGQFLSRISSLVNMLVDLHMLRLHAQRLADIALEEPESVNHRTAPRSVAKRTIPGIEFRNVRFRYSDSTPWVLDGVSFRIEPGENVALVGPSGCGKTTILKILSSLLAPTSGEVLVAGVPLRQDGLEEYRSTLGVVMQDDHLLAGTIGDNICFFDPNGVRDRIVRASQLAGLHEEILAMPMGYNSLIGDMGSALSGGQKQRVLLARALYRMPSLLLLDEATSQLDVNLEKTVNAAIRQTRVTRVIVAHRPETIKSADRVIELRGGRVVGTPALVLPTVMKRDPTPRFPGVR
jgi:ATP-binding cassette subfamily B protein RaxB